MLSGSCLNADRLHGQPKRFNQCTVAARGVLGSHTNTTPAPFPVKHRPPKTHVPMAVNPATIAAGIAAAQQIVRGGKALYNEVRPRRRQPARRRAPAPRAQKQALAGVAIAQTSTPQVSRNNMSRVERRVENVGTYTSTGTTLNMNLIHVQPGDSAAFPWLSGVAGGFAFHRFRRISYRVAPSTATSSAGRVTLAPIYTLDTGIESITDLNNAVGARSTSVWNSLEISLEVAAMYPFGRYKKIASAAVSDGSNSDAAHVYLAFDGVGSGVSVSLWVDYEVELFMPRIVQPLEMINKHTIATLPAQSINTGSDTAINAAIVAEFNPFQIVDQGSGSLLLPKGLWEIECSIELVAASAASTGGYWFKFMCGDSTAAFTDPYQVAGLKSHCYMTGYNVTGSNNILGHFDKLLYVSDGETPLKLWARASKAEIDTSTHSRLLFSPLM